MTLRRQTEQTNPCLQRECAWRDPMDTICGEENLQYRICSYGAPHDIGNLSAKSVRFLCAFSCWRFCMHMYAHTKLKSSHSLHSKMNGKNASCPQSNTHMCTCTHANWREMPASCCWKIRHSGLTEKISILSIRKA